MSRCLETAMTNDQHAEFEAMLRRIEPRACLERDRFGAYCSASTRRYLDFFLMMKAGSE